MKTTENKFSNIGVIVGLLAFAIAVFHFFLGPIEKQPTIEEYVAQKAISIKSAVASKLKGEEVVSVLQDNAIGPDKIVGYSIVILGFIAICFGVVGFLKKEEWRHSSVAISLGMSALVFKFAIALAGAIILLACIGAFLGGM